MFFPSASSLSASLHWGWMTEACSLFSPPQDCWNLQPSTTRYRGKVCRYSNTDLIHIFLFRVQCFHLSAQMLFVLWLMFVHVSVRPQFRRGWPNRSLWRSLRPCSPPGSAWSSRQRMYFPFLSTTSFPFLWFAFLDLISFPSLHLISPLSSFLLPSSPL